MKSRRQQWVEQAKDILLDLVRERETVYPMQAKAMLEKRGYFHDVTEDALKQLFAEGKLSRKQRKANSQILTFYFAPDTYPKIVGKVENIIQAARLYLGIGKETGLHGENVVESGLIKAGYIVASRNSKYFNGKEVPYKEKGDIDFIAYGRKEDRWYGVQVKNKLRYPELLDIQSFVKVCKYLGLTPWFIARTLPKTWCFKQVIVKGGFITLFEGGKWLWPRRYEDKAKIVEETIGFPILPTDEPPNSLIEDLGRISTLKARGIA